MDTGFVREMLNGLLPIIGGIGLTVFSYRCRGRKWSFEDPDFEAIWTGAVSLLRYGGPLLIVAGICIVAHALNQ